MSVFSDAELTYLAQGTPGRFATIDAAGLPHAVPLGWRYTADLDAIDISGGFRPVPQVPQRSGQSERRPGDR